MLTADMVSARVFKGELRPRYVAADDPVAIDLAEQMIATYKGHEGRKRDELNGALKVLQGDATGFLLHRGLAKLLADRSDFDVEAPCEPSVLRRRLFEEAAKKPGDRDDVIARVAAELAIDPARARGAMYADLEDEQVMTKAPDMTPEALLQRYNVGLAQAVLLRATAMTVEIAPGDPLRYRQMFRFVKFYRLMHAVSGTSDVGYAVRLDGPMSLFKLSTKYGLQLAEFFPALLLCSAWKATAEVLWGKDKRPMVLRLNSEQGLVSHYPDKGVYLTREEQMLIDRFEDLDSPWKLERRSEVIDLGGRGVLIPEFVLKHSKDGRIAYVDVMGFWKREYLEARLALLRAEAPPNLLLLVPARMRGGEDDFGDVPGEVMFFKDVIVIKELLERAERVAKKR